MKILSIGMLSCIIVATSIVSYAQNIDSVKTTDSRCGNSGTITIYATGGVTPLTYQIYSGPAPIPAPQDSATFESLAPGTYSVRVVDNNGHADTVTNNIIGGSYTVMNPTANATPPTCPGVTGGSINLSFPAGQGRAPFSYSIVSGTTSLPVSAPTTATIYTYTGLDTGTYQVRVTDSCGNFQTRTATILATATYQESINGL